jgi:hypothetical protein
VAGAGAVDEPGQAVHHPQVAVHAVGDGRPLDLEHGVAPVLQHAPVNLGDGGGRQRLGVERGEQLGGGRPQVVLDDGQGLGRRERGDVVQRAQAGVGQGGGEHAGRRRDHLAELHEGRAEGHERRHQPLAHRVRQRPPGRGVAAQAQQRPRAAGGVDHHGPDHVRGEHGPDLGAPDELASAEAREARGRRWGRGRHHSSLAPPSE